MFRVLAIVLAAYIVLYPTLDREGPTVLETRARSVMPEIRRIAEGIARAIDQYVPFPTPASAEGAQWH